MSVLRYTFRSMEMITNHHPRSILTMQQISKIVDVSPYFLFRYFSESEKSTPKPVFLPDGQTGMVASDVLDWVEANSSRQVLSKRIMDWVAKHSE